MFSHRLLGDGGLGMYDARGDVGGRVGGVEVGVLRALSPMYDAVIDEIDGRWIRIGEQWLADFASCNYLGFDLDPEIIGAVEPALRRWGTHPSWSRLLGNPRPYLDIEERLTELLGAPDTLVLPTITHIHLTVLPALVGRGWVFVESRAHRTLYDGCRVAAGAGAHLERFPSGELEMLERRLRAAPASARKVICIDGVNSMTGNLPDLAAHLALARAYGAVLYVDDAHGFGVIGERSPTESCVYGVRGNSIVRHLSQGYDDLILVGGFSKAYSSLLAFVACSTPVKEHLKIAASPYVYSGPSPVASLATTLAGFDVNERRGDRLRTELYERTARVLKVVDELGLDCNNRSGLPLLELPLSRSDDLQDVTTFLYQKGVYVTVAAYPIVPRSEIGFRIQLTAAHTDEQVDLLIEALRGLGDRFRHHDEEVDRAV
ncbi:MAG TPA: pyridoxal phosphate-dependent aminotransferase family protein [Kineosporiaceae bacterium]|nr:pyridoxal phosphate-dependent aminotransferase family protein [Kineosporiaceae bacterium]